MDLIRWRLRYPIPIGISRPPVRMPPPELSKLPEVIESISLRVKRIDTEFSKLIAELRKLHMLLEREMAYRNMLLRRFADLERRLYILQRKR
ncbi:MAG TPA: hypothetical protein ENG63_06900 [Candidatus Desulfofervidus auxilii]|uniref:Uncharacterized protein n=1 Tax=Desulfofervidus auxilii TaxID=1621989 RepID=A0A7C0Y5U2_DESA2|nr:hypothetical protein [Candidatus Desulfofervidus auxilii]